ncbi:MAG: pilus assembly protein [Robiginitomaculum sp.]|nr:pilus assembly protein [Robiginitomaculum sp.]
MMLNVKKSPLNRIGTLAKRIRDDKDGVAAIEFAFVAPVMIALYLGLAEVSMLISADRNVSHAASVTGDLATQEEALTEDEIEEIFNASLAVVGASYTNSQRISVDVISFEVDSDGDTQEVGYAKLGSGFNSKFDPSGTSATLLNQTSGLVVTRVSYDYISPSRTFVQSPTLKETFMLKPRKSKSISFGGADITCSVVNSANGPRASC